VDSLYPLSGSNFSAPLRSPTVPSWKNNLAYSFNLVPISVGDSEFGPNTQKLIKPFMCRDHIENDSLTLCYNEVDF